VVVTEAVVTMAIAATVKRMALSSCDRGGSARELCSPCPGNLESDRRCHGPSSIVVPELPPLSSIRAAALAVPPDRYKADGAGRAIERTDLLFGPRPVRASQDLRSLPGNSCDAGRESGRNATLHFGRALPRYAQGHSWLKRSEAPCRRHNSSMK